MRRYAVLLIITALFVVPAGSAAELDAPFDDIPRLELSPALSMFFRHAANPAVTADGMLMFEPPDDDVLVARITADGQVVTGCFANETPLLRFLDRNHRVESPEPREQ